MREPPKVWPEQGEDYANNMPATELRRGDKFPVCGYAEIPGYAEVDFVIGEPPRGDDYPLPDWEYVLALVRIPKTHVFDYVERKPQ